MTAYEERAKRLADVIKSILPDVQGTLEQRKREAEDLNAHEDLIWHVLLTSASTLGRSSGWDGLIGDKENYETISYTALKGLSQAEQEERLSTAMRKANVAYPDKKAEELAWNYQLIESMGGVEKAKQLLFERQGRYGKLEFLRQFKGVGPKYSRNIMMDMYHPEFHDTIAVDSRLKNILETLGFQDGELLNYEHTERFFLSAAALCGLNGWELDRILYNYQKAVLKALQD